jgi:hypothetical protein
MWRKLSLKRSPTKFMKAGTFIRPGSEQDKEFHASDNIIFQRLRMTMPHFQLLAVKTIMLLST